MATTKNTKKPQTGGETFTSLQISTKNADAAEMEHKLHLLYLLQQTDSKIDSIYLLRGELPLEVRDLEDEVAGLKTKQAAIQKEIKDIEATCINVMLFKFSLKCSLVNSIFNQNRLHKYTFPINSTLKKYTFPIKQANIKYTFLIKLWYKDYGMKECKINVFFA